MLHLSSTNFNSFSFSLDSKHFPIFLLTPSLTYVLPSSVLSDFKIFGNFSQFFFCLSLKPSVLQCYFIEGIMDPSLSVLKLQLPCLCFKLKTKEVAAFYFWLLWLQFLFPTKKIIKVGIHI